MKFSASGGDALRVRTLDTPQAAAAPTTIRNAPSGPEVPSSIAATPMPASATSMPRAWTREGRSRRTAAAITAVNTAWICSTREDSPAGMPASMPTKTRPNLATPRTSPTATIHFQATFGRPTRKTAGSAAARKRRAEKRSGGKWSRPISMTVKFTPQTAATSTARKRWEGRMRRGSAGATV